MIPSPQIRADGCDRTRPHVHNLLLHGIGQPERRLEKGEERFWLAEDCFLSILDILAARDDILITLDDGNTSDVSIVLPALLERGMKAKFFISVGMCGQRGYIDYRDARALIDKGMILGSHGMHHKNWRQLEDSELTDEIWTARDRLERMLGYHVADVAMPYGQYNRRILRRLREAGYDMVYTVDGLGAHTRDWLQPRYRLVKSDNPDTIQALLDTPLGLFNNITRACKRWVKRNRWV